MEFWDVRQSYQMTERIAAPKADELSWLKQNVIIFFLMVIIVQKSISW